MRVLIVDDLEANRMLLSYLVEKQGNVAITCSNAEDALDAYQTHGADLIFMDVVMPGVDGYAAAKQLKDVIGTYFVPIIFITALQDEDALIRCLEFGDDYLIRPFNQIMFNAKIAAHTRTIELHRKAQQQHEELNYLHTRLIQEQEMAQSVFDHATQINQQNCNNVETYLSSASQFNGDVLLTAKSPAGGIYIMLGDFTGHGLPAALGSLPLSQLFHGLVLKQLSVGDLAREMNKVLVDFLPDYMFCAAVIAELNLAGDVLKVWAGGLHDSLIVNQAFEVTERIASSHMPLGILPDEEFKTTVLEFKVKPTDKIVIYTDGILEASNDRGELFGRERFEAVMKRSHGNIDKIRKGLHRFTGYQHGSTVQDDDISLVCISAGPVTFNQDVSGLRNKPQYDINRAPVSWSICMDLSIDELRLGSPVTQLVDMVGEATGLYSYKPVLSVLIAELFNNALDHGILGLKSSLKDGPNGLTNYYNERDKRLADCESGSLKIDIRHQLLESGGGGQIVLQFEDSGAGFDTEKLLKSYIDQPHGRGLCLVKQLSEKVTFTKQGRCIEILFGYQQH